MSFPTVSFFPPPHILYYFTFFFLIFFVFFLHITTGPDNTNTILALAFGILIVTLVVSGSLWIMANLDANMVPVSTIMEMQR